MEPIYYTVREETSFGKGSSMTYNGRYDVSVYMHYISDSRFSPLSSSCETIYANMTPKTKARSSLEPLKEEDVNAIMQAPRQLMSIRKVTFPGLDQRMMRGWPNRPHEARRNRPGSVRASTTPTHWANGSRRLLGKRTPNSRDRRKSDISQDLLNIHLEYQDCSGVPIYDMCDDIRKKMNDHLRKIFDANQSSISRELSTMVCVSVWSLHHLHQGPESQAMFSQAEHLSCH